MKPKEKGYTLIELLVVIGILSLSAVAATAGIYQVIRNTELNGNHMAAVLQVQYAGNRISQDVQSAQIITSMEELSDPEFLFLSWIDMNSSDKYEITYTLEDMDTGTLKQLMRTQSVNDTGNQTSLVSSYIDYSDEMTSCNYTDGIFNLTVTVSIGGGPKTGSETRIYRIVPRSG